MKKRLFFLLGGLIILAVLGYFAYKLSSNAGTSDQKVAALDFDIKDTNAIDMIRITEPNGNTMDLIRSGKSWVDKNGGCIQQTPVSSILDAAYNIRFKGYVPDNSMKTVVSRLMTVATKVEYFSDGEWLKTWYVGTATPDHYGTYMLVESAENGKSDLPVITEIKGMKGIIGPRFFADQRRWVCSQIFAYELKDIQSVNVRFSKEPQRNFEVAKKGKGFSVTTNGKPFPVVDTALVYRYLLNYKKIHFEFANFELSRRQVDSLKSSQPFCVLTVKANSGNSQLKMYRKKSEVGAGVDDFGNEVDFDVNRFWCVLPSGELVKCQYYVFLPLIMGHIYFNYGAQNPRPI